jgi:hypothetical protein
MSLLTELHAKRSVILNLAARHKISAVCVFGSVARGDDDNQSDIDLLITPVPGASLFDYARFQIEMERLLHKKVDVVSDRSLHPLIKERILKDAVPV